MKFKPLLAITLASFLTTFPAAANDTEDKGWWDNIKSYVSDVWSDTEDEREVVAEKSKELAKKTKELGADIAEDTADLSKQVYEDGKEASAELWEKSKKTSSDLWDKTKEKVEEMKED